jgi:ribosomal protein S27E
MTNYQMRKNALDSVTIEVICRDCGTGHCRSIGYFRDHSNLTCQGCGTGISIQNKQFHASIVEFGQIMARLREPYTH